MAPPLPDQVDDLLGAYWRAWVLATTDHVFVVSPEGTILLADPKLRGADAATIVGKRLWDFAEPGAEARIRAALRRVVDEQTSVSYASQARRPDGSMGSYEVRIAPVVIGGVVERVLWAASDVTERAEAAARLDASERRLRALVEHGADCISLIAADGTVAYVSPGAVAALGYDDASQIVGRPALDFIHPDDRAAAFEAGPGSPPRARREATLRTLHRDGSYRLLEGTSQNLLDDPAVGARGGHARPGTPPHRHEGQLRQSQKMQAIGLLAGGVAHDFNNLLAIILGFSGLAAKNLAPDHPVHPHLVEVEEAARRGGELTRKLLAFSRKQLIQSHPLDVRSALDDFTRMLERIVGEDVELQVERAPTPLPIRADPAQLEQVLMNLCANARQAMPEGGTLRIATRTVNLDVAELATRPWAKAGAFVEIVVRDTGHGMDDATLARAFEPFFTTKREGTGLGLAMVYGIVEQHGGFLHVESTVGRGTAFYVYLPRTNDAIATPTGPRSVRGPAARGGHETILLAEDEPALRALAATTLTELGYQVVATRDGEEAVREFERRDGQFALVVLDVVMPRLGAREAYDRMRRLAPSVRVLFTTGYAPASTRIGEIVADDAVPLLEKPFTPEALGAAVRDAIDRRGRTV